MNGAPQRFAVVIEPLGWAFEAGADQTLFDAARQAGIRLPALCRNGTCRTCFSKLRSGRVDYVVPYPGLSREEREEGWVLPCVAAARSDLVLEIPEATRWGDPY